VRKLLATLCDVWMRLSRPDQALSATAVGLENFPGDPELSLRRADLLGRLGNLHGAEQCLQALLAAPETDYLKMGVAEDDSRREARRLLAVVHQDQGRLQAAEQELRQLLEECPDFVQGWVNLGYVYLAGGQYGQLDAVIRCMEGCPRAEQHLARGELAAARPLLEMAIARAPRMLWPRWVLSDWLLKQGDDLEGFRAVQRDILRLDPGNPRALANLQRFPAGLPLIVAPLPLGWSITV
jgi:tetratricopeptide (TPR) repeat protein